MIGTAETHHNQMTILGPGTAVIAAILCRDHPCQRVDEEHVLGVLGDAVVYRVPNIRIPRHRQSKGGV